MIIALMYRKLFTFPLKISHQLPSHEISLTRDGLYAILSNKSATGKKGVYCRKKVSEITLKMARSMNLIVHDDNEWLAIFCKETLQREHFDYFIFGHRHYPINISVGSSSIYINLGEWITYQTYGVFDGEKFDLLTYKS